jgi:hypothetical protein
MSKGSTGCCSTDMSKDSTSLYFFRFAFFTSTVYSLRLFLFVSVQFRFRFQNVTLRCEISGKNSFLALKRKNISLSFCFVSLEAKMNGAPYEQPYSISTQDHSLKGTQADNFVGSDFEFVTVLWLVVEKDYFLIHKMF